MIDSPPKPSCEKHCWHQADGGAHRYDRCCQCGKRREFDWVVPEGHGPYAPRLRRGEP